MDLQTVDMAVLSACDTGAGQIRTGEGDFGIRRAFHLAGARTLIMSLWAVEDRSTAEWMERFYRGILEDGFDKARAVQQASRKMSEHRRKEGLTTHPFFWAGFISAGVWN